MSTLIFDSSSIISLVMNNLIHIIPKIKKDNLFYIPQEVKKELVDNALKTKKYKLEAMMVSKKIEENIFQLHETINYQEIDNLANTLFEAKGHKIQIVHAGELEALALAIIKKADALVIDERTTRLLIENPIKLHKLLERKLHTKIKIDRNNLEKIKKLVKEIKVIRSTELTAIALERGLLKDFFPTKTTKKQQIEALLWGLRLRGCSLSNEDLNKIPQLIK